MSASSPAGGRQRGESMTQWLNQVHVGDCRILMRHMTAELEDA
jgi:hypothetical protein